MFCYEIRMFNVCLTGLFVCFIYITHRITGTTEYGRHRRPDNILLLKQ